MAWTYDPTRTGVECRDRARFLLGDTTGGDTAVLLDEEIDAVLAGAPTFGEGVAQLAESCAAKVAQQPDTIEDETGFKAQWTQIRIRTWIDLAARLRAGASGQKAAAVPYGPAGGSMPDHVEWPG